MQTPKRKPGKYTSLPLDPLMTRVQFDKLQNKLKKLKQIQPEAAREVSRLAELGDFSENVEYQLAKGRLRGINQNILNIEKQLNTADLIQAPRQNAIIEVGHTVTLEVNGKQKTYQILGSSETNPNAGIISHSSPLGATLIGKKVGEVMKLKANGREVEYAIRGIE